jgi:hypothetical protein
MPKIEPKNVKARKSEPETTAQENDFDVSFASKPVVEEPVQPVTETAKPVVKTQVENKPAVKPSPVNRTNVVQFSAKGLEAQWKNTSNSARTHRLNTLARTYPDVRSVLDENESLRKQVELLTKQ